MNITLEIPTHTRIKLIKNMRECLKAQGLEVPKLLESKRIVDQVVNDVLYALNNDEEASCVATIKPSDIVMLSN